MKADLLDMLETMAQSGTAPESGCDLFGIGYDDAFKRIKKVYLDRQFEKGHSAEKFVVGPFGSGKTHFLRQLFAIAEANNCAFAEVHLNKDVDFTQRLIVYREIARAVRLPNSSGTGIRSLLSHVLSAISAQTDGDEDIIIGWIEAIDQLNLEEIRYARQLKKTLLALYKGECNADSHCRWLEGDVKDKALCKEVGEQAISNSEENLFANRAMYSLFQFIRHATYRGTVVGFDEAEQGFSVERKKMQKILSMLQAGINAVSELHNASVLLIYALTPDIVAEMEKFAALQQRVSDPSETETFFDGNTYATKIDLTRRGSAEDDLCCIGTKLTELFLSEYGGQIPVDKAVLLADIKNIATEVALNDPTTSNRRTMTKRVSHKLLRLHDEMTGSNDYEEFKEPAFAEPEV